MPRSRRTYVPDPLMAAADLIETWLRTPKPTQPEDCREALDCLAEHVQHRTEQRQRKPGFVAQLIEHRAKQAGLPEADPATYAEVLAFLAALEEPQEPRQDIPRRARAS